MSINAFLATGVLCALASGAPAPAPAPHFHSPTHRRHANPLDYYVDSPEMATFYTLARQKDVEESAPSQNAPARLETLEPDSEVELVPGVQPPQPPQQHPLTPNIPGLIPGQRVFIVQMPIPGYRPGTISGYQPVYIVAAAPQDSYASGFQNTILVDPSVQAVSPAVSGELPELGPSPRVLFGAPVVYGAASLAYQHPANYQKSNESPPGSDLSQETPPGSPPIAVTLDTESTPRAGAGRAAAGQEEASSEDARVSAARTSRHSQAPPAGVTSPQPRAVATNLTEELRQESDSDESGESSESASSSSCSPPPRRPNASSGDRSPPPPVPSARNGGRSPPPPAASSSVAAANPESKWPQRDSESETEEISEDE